jgi:hypothetical protein
MTDQPVTDEAGESNMDTSIQWRTRTYKNGAAPQQVPTYDDVALQRVSWYRGFAQKAGVRNAAKAAAKSGIPIQVAVAIFCKDAAQAVEAYMKWEMTEREFRFSEWEPDDSGY